MADEQDTPEVDAEDGEAPKKKKLSGKVLVLFIGLPVLLLLGGGGAAFMMMSGSEAKPADTAKTQPVETEQKEEVAEAPAEEPVPEGGGDPAEMGKVNYAGSDLIFFELPDMIVNLNTSGSQPRFLRIRVALEFGDKKIVTKVRKVMPRIVDHFQVYLRELRREDLRGSAGMYRLKEELMIRVNQTVEPMQIRDVLFKEVLVQ